MCSVHISCEYIYIYILQPAHMAVLCWAAWVAHLWHTQQLGVLLERIRGNFIRKCFLDLILMWASRLWVPFIDSFLLGASIWHFGVWRTNFSLWAAILIASNMDMVLQQNNVQKNPCNDICWQDWCLGKRRKKTWSGTLTHTPFSEVA